MKKAKEQKSPVQTPAKQTKAKKPTTTAKTTSAKTTLPKPKRQVNYMLIKSEIDREGNQKYTAVRTYTRLPKGWKETKGATTAPKGYTWIDNGKSRFSGKRKSALVKA